MHGIDHVLLFDHGTTDHSYRELEPWLKSGFVTILTNITEMIEDMPRRTAIKKKGEFEYLMQGKAHLEKVYTAKYLSFSRAFIYNIYILSVSLTHSLIHSLTP
jgi:hypothetical protein